MGGRLADLDLLSETEQPPQMRGLLEDATLVPTGCYGVKTSVWHGRPPQTSTTLPFASRKSDFCARAAAVARTSPWGSRPVVGGAFVSGGGETRPGPSSQ